MRPARGAVDSFYAVSGHAHVGAVNGRDDQALRRVSYVIFLHLLFRSFWKSYQRKNRHANLGIIVVDATGHDRLGNAAGNSVSPDAAIGILGKLGTQFGFGERLSG